MTPLDSIVQRGAEVYARDMAGQESALARCPDVTVASWVAWSISQHHSVPHKIEPPRSSENRSGPPDIRDVKRLLAAAEVHKAGLGFGVRDEHTR